MPCKNCENVGFPKFVWVLFRQGAKQSRTLKCSHAYGELACKHRRLTAITIVFSIFIPSNFSRSVRPDLTKGNFYDIRAGFVGHILFLLTTNVSKATGRKLRFCVHVCSSLCSSFYFIFPASITTSFNSLREISVSLLRPQLGVCTHSRHQNAAPLDRTFN